MRFHGLDAFLLVVVQRTCKDWLALLGCLLGGLSRVGMPSSETLKFGPAMASCVCA